jgi:hypothetical protein
MTGCRASSSLPRQDKATHLLHMHRHNHSHIASKLTTHVHTFTYCFLLCIFLNPPLIPVVMSHHRYMSWPNAHMLTMAPTYPPAGAASDHPSPAASRRPSACFSEISMCSSRRDSVAGFASDMESTGQWQSIGSESRSPLAQFGFLKSLTEKKTTRGSLTTTCSLCSLLTTSRWPTAEKKRSQARQQASLDTTTRAQSSGTTVNDYKRNVQDQALTSWQEHIGRGKSCTSRLSNKRSFASKILSLLPRGNGTPSLKRTGD